MVFVVLCPGAPKGSTRSGSGFEVSQKTGPGLIQKTGRSQESNLQPLVYKA